MAARRVAVAARADEGLHQDGRAPSRASRPPHLVDERHRPPVHRCERRGVVAELSAPVRVGAPRRSVEDERGTVVAGEVEERPVVPAQRLAPVLGLDEREGREARQIDALVEQEHRLHPGVGERQRPGHASGGDTRRVRRVRLASRPDAQTATTRSSSAAATTGSSAAAYLARAGLRVVVLERRHVLGGAAVTEEIVPGFRFSVASYVVSLLRPEIMRELELPRHGLADPAARRHAHAARRRLPVARERPRPDRARAAPVVALGRRGVRGVRDPHGPDGPLHQADPRPCRPTRAGSARPNGSRWPRLHAASPPSRGASATRSSSS